MFGSFCADGGGLYGGDTVSYERVAEVVGREVKREVWTVPMLRDELVGDPDDVEG